MTEILLYLPEVFICTSWDHIDFVEHDAFIKEMLKWWQSAQG